MSSAPNPTAPASSATASSAPATREAAAMSVRHAAVWAMAGQYISFAIMFANSVIISRFFLTPAEIGLFSIALAASMVAAVLQDFGLSRYIAGLRVVDAEALSRCASVAFLFSFVVAGIIAASAWPMALTYHQKALFPILLIIAASYLFVPLSVVPMALMGRTMSFHGHFCVNVGGAVALAGSALTLSALGLSSFALAWATLIAAIARAAIAQALRPAAPWPLRTDGVRPIMANGAKLTTLYGIGALGSRTPDMIVGKLLGLLSVGLYSRAASLSDQFRMLISGAIGSVFYPAFARKRDAGEPLGPPYLRVVAGYTAIIWPGMAGLALASRPVVHLLYGDRWTAVAPLLSAISLTEIFLVMLPLHTDLPILLGRLNRLMVFNVADTVISLSLLALGCLWGLEGAAISRLVYGLCWLALYARFLHGLVGFDVRALLTIYAKSAAGAVAALAPLAGVYLCWVGPDAITMPVLLPAVGAGVGLWLAVLVLVRHPALDDLFAMAAHLPGGRVLAPLARIATRR